MNKERRAELSAIKDELQNLKSRLEIVRSDEQDYIDNMPGSFEQKREDAQEVLNHIDSADDELQSVIDELDEVEL